MVCVCVLYVCVYRLVAPSSGSFAAAVGAHHYGDDDGGDEARCELRHMNLETYEVVFPCESKLGASYAQWSWK